MYWTGCWSGLPHSDRKRGESSMLYIMRHGRTDWNERHKLQGRTDIPLNEDGRRMAEAAREEYLDVPLDICYCSPLIRAKETAEIVLRGRDIRIRTDERLREMSFGEYEGIENSFSIPDCPVNVIFQHPEAYTRSVGGAETFSPGSHRSPDGSGKERADRRSRGHEPEHHQPDPEASHPGFLDAGNRELQNDPTDLKSNQNDRCSFSHSCTS